MDREMKIKLIMLLCGAGVTGSVYLIFKYLFPIVAPFVIALLIACVIERPVCRLSKKFNMNKTIAAIIIMGILTVVIAGLVGFLGYKGFMEIKQFAGKSDQYMDMASDMLHNICEGVDDTFGLEPGSVLKFMEDNMDGIVNQVKNQIIPVIMGGSIPIVVTIVAFMAVFFIIIMSVVFISKDLDKMRAWKEHSLYSKEVRLITNKLTELGKTYFKIQLFIMCCTATICIIGLYLIGNPYAIIIGILIGLLDALPLFGTGTVLLPWSMILLITGNITNAAILFTIYNITYFLREFIESKYMGDKLGIAPFTMLIIIYGGIMLYGIWGFILGPVSYVIIKTMILYLKTRVERGTLSGI